MSENVFLENNKFAGTYRSTFHFKKWLLWAIGFLLITILVTPMLPPNVDDTNEWSFILSIGFFGFIIAVDHLITGWFYIRGRTIK